MPTSMHKHRAIAVAFSKGAWSAEPEAREFWDLPKRVLIEAALRLAASAANDCDNVTSATVCLHEEVDNLRASGII